MYGFQAIDAANGWMIAFAGITIVFMGLVVLASLIANMERALKLWDRRGELLTAAKHAAHPRAVPLDPIPQEHATLAPGEELPVTRLSLDQMEALNHFQWLTERMGQTFALPHLLEKAEKRGLSQPYSHLAALLKLGLLIEGQGELQGFYSWRKDVNIVSSQPTLQEEN